MTNADDNGRARSGALAPRARRNPRSVLLHGLFLVSGIAALGYQIAWTRLFTVGLGHEMPSVLAVVAAFFVGIALGAWILDGPVSRSRRPGLWYAGLEAAIGAWALASLFVIPWANARARMWIGLDPSALRHWTVAFLVPSAALLPATIAMGATLPAMERVVSSIAGRERCVGGLYAANTLGAVIGVLGAAFWLVPTFGLRTSVTTLAALSLACAVASFVATRTIVANDASATHPPNDRPNAPSIGRLRLYVTVFVTGLLGIGAEVVGVRVLGQVTQNTVYSFAAALIAYLLGTAIGAAAYQRWLAGRARDDFRGVLTALLVALASTGLLGIFVLRSALAVNDALSARLGTAPFGAILTELLTSAAYFALPTMVMGATFSHLVQGARGANGGVGRATAVNTLGGAVAPFAFGVVALPALGARNALVVASAGYLVLIPRLGRWSLACIVLLGFLVATLPENLWIVTVPDGGGIRAYRDGVMAAVAVVADRNGDRYLRVNNRFQMGATIGGFAERRLADLPLLLHPNPRRVLFLGLGTGTSLGTAAKHPIEHGDGVELVPEIVEVMDEFAPVNNAPTRQPALSVVVADARRYVEASTSLYDVIVGDLFHPARDGAGSLYTIEHFNAVRARLAPGGIFCQWLPLYQLDDETVRVIVHTFLQAFPHARAYVGHYNVRTPMLALVGSADPIVYDPAWFAHRPHSAALQGELEDVALWDEMRLFGCLVAGPEELEAMSRDAGTNTDDDQIVTYQAPWFAYRGAESPYGRLLPFIQRVPDGVEGLVPDDDRARTGFLAALRRYIAARNVYLTGMIAGIEGRQDEAIDACIESARISEDFTTGYVQAIEYVNEMAKRDPQRCRAVLRALAKAQPGMQEAQRLLHDVFGE
ncbi:MAG: hypothetical protein U0572_00275 [Phycisphaerales bacterium]